MRTYHLMDKKEWLACINYFRSSHCIDLPNGRVLVAAEFHDDWAEERFHTIAKSKKSLPHPLFDSGKTLHADHQDELKHLIGGIDKPTVHDVIGKAAAIHPLMKLRYQDA